MQIGGRSVGDGQPLFVMAELGLNHGGDLHTALAMVDAAAGSGAAAVKLQTLDADRLVTADAPAPMHVAAASLRAFFRAFELDEAAHRAVAGRARSRGVAFVSTPFDERAVDLLVRVGADALKIASGDLTHHHLIATAARTGLPLILSTGMSNLTEVAEAVGCARMAGAHALALLHCVSSYPVPQGHENLHAISELAEAFQVPVGLSDHGTDPLAAALTVALGGAIFEKHFVLAEDGDEIDAAVSVSPAGLATIVRTAERARLSLGDGRKVCLPVEAGNLAASRRSLFAARDLRAGDRITGADLVALRPGTGVEARRWRELAGQRLTRDVAAGEPFIEADVCAPTGRVLDHARTRTDRPGQTEPLRGVA
ncbi:MAG: N-acetylneuraminate synthase family protein [Vicinamibacterales bacterium]|nr:N-acetylneuraminate synthase family protein [Vicinamibacterales bacterium]